MSRQTRTRFVRTTATALLVAAATAAFTATPAAAVPNGTVLAADSPTAVSGSYIVVLNDVTASEVNASANGLANRYGGKVVSTWRDSVRGFHARMSAAAAKRLAADPAVQYVEQNQTVHLVGTQSPTPSWGLDRIDQRNLPLDDSYTYPNTASGVTAYIIDTGIRISHNDFGGRATWGTNTVDSNNTDCNGHGTHVASTTGGTAYGVAKGVSLVAVKVLNCQGSGTYAGVIEGIDWVTSQHTSGAAVANMSLGGSFSQAVNDAVTASIADGVTYALAAGNSNANACNSSPSSTPNAITVGATQDNDARASFSNYGSCLDIFAPGVNITAAWNSSDSATNTISGTSMASPHTAGVAALIKAANPSYTPQQVRDKMVADGTDGVVGSPGSGSPNVLLYVANDTTPPTRDFSISVSPTSGTIAVGKSGTATVNTATTAGSAQTVNLSSSGAPSGVSVSFSPSSVTSGNSSTMTINVASSAANGTYPITITGSGETGTKTATFTLTVTGGTGGQCSGTNATNTNIPDPGTVESSIALTCNRNGSSSSKVEVHIEHTWRGDLVIDLIAPDGSAYRLKNWSWFDWNDDVHATYTVNLSSESGSGTWKLRVTDVFGSDSGYIDTWTLTL